MWWKVVLKKMPLTKVGPYYISTIPSRTTPLFSFLFLRLPYPCDVERRSAEVLLCPAHRCLNSKSKNAALYSARPWQGFPRAGYSASSKLAS